MIGKELVENLSIDSLNLLNANDVMLTTLERLKFLDKTSNDYKFKAFGNQLVVETKDYYYKVYIDNFASAKYLLEIRKKLSKIYESYGIHWKIIDYYFDGLYITVEQREKLKICDYKDITAEELLKNWKRTVDLLRDSLKFDDILIQLKEKSNVLEFNNAKELLLIRRCLLSPEDYAFAPNGNVVLLDDTDFVILVIDENKKPISKRNFDFEVMTTCGTLNFSSDRQHWEKKICANFDISKLFFLIENNNKTGVSFITNDINNIENKLKIFATGKPINSKYKNEYYEEYNKKYEKSLKNNEKSRLN